ncbi:beta-lactamase family protein [Sphingomonas suaedae]|uniref:Beta-lactamase family protein n=1 Tax=Sphingomonas suaedae TaxID=2599297 RepID=A0A518RIE3_9SPHN|nr:serine hydrolase domain-containing protein [Sphingomonas suaedae]QDX27194.1 beta-lactamase family protein [Sphingomonas suaedae]
MIRFLLALPLALAGCATPSAGPGPSPLPVAEPVLHGQIDAILTKGGITTAGIGVMRGGRLVFEHYHGDAGGTPANPDTRFDVASITKTVAAETYLRMVAAGQAELDTPLSRYWVDPDVQGDPRHRLLTARMILTHRSGLPNWRLFRADRKLAFERNPGSGYGYSGEGIEYLWRAMERRHGASFPVLADRYLLRPIGVTSATLTVDRADRVNVALGVDEQGKRYDPGCRPGFCWPEGQWSAAGGMLITLRDYAKVMAAISDGGGYGIGLRRERNRIVTDRGGESVVDCTQPRVICPKRQGYGLGFDMVDMGGRRTIGHEGGDWSQLTIAYSDLPSRDGLIIFLNVPMRRGIAPMRDLIALLDPDSPYAARFEKWAREGS